MRTFFEESRLEDEDILASSKAIRRCVHCGLCTATCPTYLLLRDERDSPRGRIYMMKSILEEDRAPTREEMKHVDRCLSCLSCTTTCPSGVDYRRLVDHMRSYMESHRSLWERLYRKTLWSVMTKAWRARCLFVLLRWGLGVLSFVPYLRLKTSRVRSLMPRWDLHPMASDVAGVFFAEGEKRGRVLLPRGCVQRVVGAQIHDRVLKLLTWQGFEVIVPEGGCCGALGHHMGYVNESRAEAEHQVRCLHEAEEKYGKVDAVLSHASGCGSVMKDYGALLGSEGGRDYGSRVEDVSFFLSKVGMRGRPRKSLAGMKVVYHAACSLQHGQGFGGVPPDVLSWTGAEVLEMKESHICCGSAGMYNVLQGEIADLLRERKRFYMSLSGGSCVVTGNIGCLLQLSGAEGSLPVCHVAELLYWSGFGERPYSFCSSGLSSKMS